MRLDDSGDCYERLMLVNDTAESCMLHAVLIVPNVHTC